MDFIYGFWARVTGAVMSLEREEGQTFTEYAIIVATIAIGVVASVGFLRSAVTNALTAAANDI
jgi:Flp pilus assembly pilin Flp